jgi:energy-coupling factor transporter ATP-binding protein EcfA2
MKHDELQRLEMLAEVDDLTASVTSTAAVDAPWEPLRRSSALLRRVLERVHTLRIRLEAPLVVATFGGTGTGKSTLVNALVGAEVTASGRQRPTTRRPILIAHHDTELEALGLPLDDFDVHRADSDLLKDVVIIDCPDPDTSDTDSVGTNLDRLRHILPHCDVLIYTSTQQKYRSARVVDELAEAATGCRLVFVQTHADIDEDIRADWREHLGDRYEVPDVFYVDSLKALREQQAGQQPSGEMRRLMDLLTRQLAAAERSSVRRANVIDLLLAALVRCRELIASRWSEIAQLDAALTEQQAALRHKMADRLRRELHVSRNLWERRLLAAATDIWGLSPFSAVLRLYNGIGSFIASFTLFRARSSAQLAILGAVQGVRWLERNKQEHLAEQTLTRAGALGLDDELLRESQLVIAGHVHAAHLDPQTVAGGGLTQLRSKAARVEGEFLDDAGQRIDEIIQQLAVDRSRWYVRLTYELLFLAYVGFVLYRIGYNFFYESLLNREAILSTDFYVPAAVFLLLWAGLLVILFTRRLRHGLDRQIDALAAELVDRKLAGGLFPELQQLCDDTRRHRDRLEQLAQRAEELRREIAGPAHLGVSRPPLRTASPK